MQLFVASVHASARRTIGERVIEIGADAAVPSGAEWQQVQLALLESLEAQLTEIATPTPKPEAVRSALRQAVRAPQPTHVGKNGASTALVDSEHGDPEKSNPTRFQVPPPCKANGVPFQMREKDGATWWSHRHGAGWCNYKEGS